jgi:hypothetical protein
MAKAQRADQENCHNENIAGITLQKDGRINLINYTGTQILKKNFNFWFSYEIF